MSHPGAGPVPPSPAAVPAPPASLPERLREATREAHARAEQAGAMPALLAGRLGAEAYLRLHRNLHALYAALEAALADAPPALAPLARMVLGEEGLARAPRLAEDLQVLHGPGWASDLPLLPALHEAVARLQRLQAARDPALAAHAYTRYLGDLHGGQVLRQRARAVLGADRGSSFYDFGPAPRPQRLRVALREALAALPLGPEAQQAVVDEALWSFAMHERLFVQLAEP